MSVGPWQLIIVAIVILVLFGRGRISEMMGDFGKGIKSFKQGMADEAKPQAPAPRIENQPAESSPESPSAKQADNSTSSN